MKVPVLMVDDRPENLMALEAVLRSPDYRLVAVNSGAQALAALLREDFAVVLLDVQMPEMDGFEAAELIRRRERSRAIPIVFITAIHQDLMHVSRGYELGAVDYILKPFDPSILRSKVAVFAELYRKRLEIEQKSEELFQERLERERAEILQRHYRDVIDRLDHSIIWEADVPSGNFRFVSRNARKLLGYPVEDWFHLGFLWEHVPQEDQSILRGAFQRTLPESSDQRCEHRIISKSGTVLWFHTGIQLESDARADSGLLYRGLSVDITPLKIAEEDLRRRETKFRRVVDSNMIGHIFVDLDGRIFDANEYFLRMLGYDRVDLEGGRLDWKAITPSQYRTLDENAIREIRETGVCTPFEKEYIAKDGRRIPVMLGAALLEESNRTCVCFVLDLTDRKKAEEEKIRAVKAREDLLEIVSHDLRNPLSAILMNATLLFRRLPDQPDNQTLKKKLQVIQTSADQMKRLIEDLMDLAKVEAGRLPVNPKPNSVPELLATVTEMFEPISQEKGIELITEGPTDVEPLDFDRDRILQVLSNLVANAIKFTPPRGKVILRATTEPNHIKFEVVDTGPGIASLDQPHIFERYWAANREDRSGAGLGLSISKGIVEAHGGRIWVESKSGVGSKLSFVLPRKKEPARSRGA